MAAISPNDEIVIDVRNVTTRFGSTVVHDGVSLDVRRGETFALAGGIGCGKSVLMREIIMLRRPDAGSISVFGQELQYLDEETASNLRRRWGVMFQRGGLFTSLTVAENVALPLREHTGLSGALIGEIATFKIALTGLPPSAAAKYPDELSGGMRKRASLARAIALDPELLLLDEPTTGLDPLSATEIDDLIRHLKEALGLTILMVTHDLDLLWHLADRVAILGYGPILGIGTMDELSGSADPVVHEYFYGLRGRAARAQSWKQR